MGGPGAAGYEGEPGQGATDRRGYLGPALLRAVNMEGRSCVLKELQPREDRLTFQKIEPPSLEGAVRALGQLLAWAPLRASERHGAASPDALVEHAQEDSWTRPLSDYAAAYAKRARADYREFREAWKDGFFEPQVGKVTALRV